MSLAKNWLCLWLLWCCCSGVLAQSLVLNVYNNGEYELTDYLLFHEDKDSRLSVADLKDPNVHERFKSLENRHLTFGLTHSSLWFKLQIRYPKGAPNTEPVKTFYYEVGRAQLDIAELHILRADGRIETVVSDVRQPLHEKPVVHINSVFPIDLALGEEVTLYLRVQNKTGTFLPQTLWTPEAFATKVSHEEYFYGIFYGGMIVMVIYNLLLYFSTRTETYLYYAIFLLTALSLEFVDMGHGFTLVKADIGILHKQYIPFFFWLLWLVGMRYTQHYLEIRERHPAINYTINAFYFVSFFSLLIALHYDYYATVQFIAHFGGTAVLMVLALSLYVWYKGNENAEFFTYAWACNMLGFSLYSSVVVGLAPAYSLLIFAMPMGTLLEAIFLSLALADKIKRAQKQTLDANSRSLENLARYRSVFDNAIEGLYQMTPGGRLLSVNHAFARLLGYDSPEAVIEHTREAVGYLFPDAERQQARLANDDRMEEELALVGANGVTVNATHVALLVRNSDGLPMHIEGKLVDRRERLERERAMRERLSERQAKQLATRATEGKSELLRHMSHLIRTPLTAIIGFGEGLRENQLPAAERKDSIGRVIENSRTLLQLINNILDYSKIEAHKLSIETIEVDLDEVLKKLRQQTEEMLATKRPSLTIQIAPQVPRHVMTDPTRLLQILHNLCSNAIRHGNHADITLRLSWNPGTQRLKLDVVDTGKGISETALQQLRKTLADRHQLQPPQGLGLLISQRLTELMGGQLHLHSIEGQGFTVTIELPVRPSAQTGMLDTAGTSAPPEKTLLDIPRLSGRVLLADDNAVNRKLIERVVSKTGATLVAVEDGKQAVDSALGGHFDLVLMDINMPVMNGLEATRILREQGYTSPIYALTAETDTQALASYVAAGCQGHLAKPLELGPFYAVMSTHLQLQQPPASQGRRG